MHEIAVATESLSPRHNYIPWLVVDDTHTDEIQSEAEFNFLQFVCATYTGELPEECFQEL